MDNPFELLQHQLQEIKELLQQPREVNGTSVPEIIDRVELCKRLNITEPTAIRLEKKGKLPCIRLGSSIRYNWPTVVSALESKKGRND